MLTQQRVFTLLRSLVRVHILQLLRGDEKYVARELRVQAWECHAQRVVRLTDRADDVAHGAAKIALAAVLARNDLFPVPLIDVDGMEIVGLFVAPDGVHVGEEALSGVELIALQGQTLPFGKRMDNLRLRTDVGDVEADGALIAVEIVVEAGALLDKQRCGYAAQIECIAQIDLKIAFDEFNCTLQFVDRQRRPVTGGDGELAHMANSFLKNNNMVLYNSLCMNSRIIPNKKDKKRLRPRAEAQRRYFLRNFRNSSHRSTRI